MQSVAVTRKLVGGITYVKNRQEDAPITLLLSLKAGKQRSRDCQTIFEKVRHVSQQETSHKGYDHWEKRAEAIGSIQEDFC
jgi:hypothetical protein